MAEEKGCEPSQLALAWLLAQGEDIVPIPGTKRRKYLDSNLGALQVNVSKQDLEQIDKIAPRGAFAGERYPAEQMKSLNQ